MPEQVCAAFGATWTRVDGKGDDNFQPKLRMRAPVLSVSYQLNAAGGPKSTCSHFKKRYGIRLAREGFYEIFIAGPDGRLIRAADTRPRNTRPPVSRGGAPGSSVSPMARASTAIEPHRLTRNNGAYWPTP